MRRDTFIEFLNKATDASVAFANMYVDNDLPAPVRYLVLMNQSYDAHATVDEWVYPEDDGREVECQSVDEVANLLVRNERCPAWSDVSVEAQSSTETIVHLWCCGRFVNDLHRMYYTSRGMGPFGIKSPVFPIGFENGGTKFTLPMVKPGGWRPPHIDYLSNMVLRARSRLTFDATESLLSPVTVTCPSFRPARGCFP